jgi:hypothetical protein
MLIVWSGTPLLSQLDKSTVYFHSEDSLLITADEYLTSDTLPYLLLFHEQNSSRGEFNEIITRFQKMNFNCLVPDIRNGGNSNAIGNETAKRCRIEELSRSFEMVESDIRSSITYAAGKSKQDVILLGAGENGSLVLKAAKELATVKAAIALSPGEFFQPNFRVEEVLSGLEKPLLITSSRIEFPYMEQIVSNVDDQYKRIFAPEDSDGERGTNALFSTNPSSSDYWLAILLFFKDLQ